MNERARAARIAVLLEMERIRRSPVYWLEHYAWTIDEHVRGGDNERKLYHGRPFIDPGTLQPMRELDGGVDDYIMLIAAQWWNEELLAVPKSRQLRLTHIMVNLHGWLAMMHPGQRICVQSKKEEDADATLQRLRESLRISQERNPALPFPQMRYKYARGLFANGSIIMAVAQGAQTVRQYTFSAIFSDEMAFQLDAEDAFTAAIPTIEGGGKYCAVSSAHPSFFEQLVFDRTDAT